MYIDVEKDAVKIQKIIEINLLFTVVFSFSDALDDSEVHCKK